MDACGRDRTGGTAGGELWAANKFQKVVISGRTGEARGVVEQTLVEARRHVARTRAPGEYDAGGEQEQRCDDGGTDARMHGGLTEGECY